MSLFSRHYFAWLRRLRATPPVPHADDPIDARYATLALRVANAGTWRLDWCDLPGPADAAFPWEILHFADVSQRALDIWGQPPLSPRQRCTTDVWRRALLAANDPASATLALTALENAVRLRIGYDITYAYQRPSDQRVVWLRDVAHVVHDRQNRPLAVLGMTTDVSLQRNSDTRLLHSSLLNETASQMKSEFLARTGHAIRTPMNAIIGLSHLALKTELTARQRDYLRKIEQSGQQLLGVINNILDISRMEAGQLAVAAADFELATVLDRVVTPHRKKANDTDIELIISVDRTLPCVVRGDAQRLEQILSIYVDNAIQFTQHGEIKIAVYPERESDDWLWLRFDVRDTGIGVPADQLPRLFLSAPEASAGATGPGGAGLGLVIAKRLATLMHGSVGVESTPGHGAYFWFTARLDMAETAPSPRLEQPDLRGKRVLVVDDNEHARLVLVDMLSELGLQADSSEGGYAALEAVLAAHQAKQPFELVFLDWQMPDLNGIEVARRLYAQDMTPAPRLVMVTAFARHDVLETAQNAGIDDVLVKPVTASALFDAASRSFRSESATPLPTSAPRPDELPPRLASIAGARILVVEDNAINQLVAFEFLTGAGFDVTLANDGQAALAQVLAPAQHWDLVLMDLQMNGMDGLHATREIRKIKAASELPIVAMTASAWRADRDACLDAGMQDFLSKPIDPQALWRTLLLWIAPRPQPTDAASASVPNAPSASTSMPLSTSTSAWPLAPIDGLDTVTGLQRVLGRQTTYRRLLTLFLQQEKWTCQTLHTLLDQQQLQAVQRIAHATRSCAANIGAGAIETLALAIEQAVEHQASVAHLRTLVNHLQPPLDALLSVLTRQLPTITETSPAMEDGDALPLPAVIEALLRLLHTDDVRAGDLFERYAASLQATFPAFFSELETAITHFEYRRGERLLQHALATAEERSHVYKGKTDAHL